MIEKIEHFVIDKVIEPFAQKVQRKTGWDNFGQVRFLLWLCVLWESVRLVIVHDNLAGPRAMSIASVSMFALITVTYIESHCKKNIQSRMKNNLRHVPPYKILFYGATFFSLPFGLFFCFDWVFAPTWDKAYFAYNCCSKALAVYLCACTPLPPTPKLTFYSAFGFG